VVAANAGGVFTPFGDITSLMVWQQGLLEFKQFLSLGAPALVNWLIPATVLSFTFPEGQAETRKGNTSQQREGALIVVLLFALTLIGSVWFESYLHLPAAIGMMTGLGVLKLYGYRLKRKGVPHVPNKGPASQEKQFDIFRSLERSEWDTLMFLLGIVLSIGGLAAMGYLLLTSEFLYGVLGPTAANTLMGLVSAFVENVPLMFSVLGMQPVMDHNQWLLVTLTASVGGSLLSIGSAAGVAVMGQAQGVYTFMSHLRWTWVIALGYAVSIGLHFVLNAGSL
jgi:Na+/H+ antiporter NhaD/arsenite permease-like protein